MDLLNQRFRLRDGRTLGFAVYGRPDGTPLFYLHGWPSSRLEPFAMSQCCSELGVRLIAPDRPGLGLSDFQPGRKIPDFVGDLTELADHLDLERFAVLGVSGGGPYAAACAALLERRLSAAVLVCSVGPVDAPDACKGMVAINRWLLATARRFPRVAQCIGGLCLRIIWRKGDQAIPKQIEVRLPPSDRKALESTALRQALTNASLEALRHGTRGAAADGLLYGRPWGFSLASIRVPVFVWHGEADVIVPATMGHHLARMIPGCCARFFPEDGHFSLPYNRTAEILQSALSEGRA
jgi:pimeloyl-ACP methyl ester carboxylesterase